MFGVSKNRYGQHVGVFGVQALLICLLLLPQFNCQFNEAPLPSNELIDDLPTVDDDAPGSEDSDDEVEEVEEEPDNIPILTLVEDPYAEDASGNTFVFIHFHLSDDSQANVQYGVAPLLDQETKRETSFDYAEHRQRILDLTPGVTYNYRILATDEDGNELVSNVFSFTKL